MNIKQFISEYKHYRTEMYQTVFSAAYWALFNLASDDGILSKLLHLIDIYRQYRCVHSPLYSAKIAYGIAFRGLPF